MAFLKLLFLYTLRYLVPLMPHRARMVLASLTGFMEFKGGKRALLEKELHAVFNAMPPDSKTAQRIIFEAFRNFHLDLFEIWSFPGLDRNALERLVAFEGRWHLDDALKKKGGVLIAVTHFGSWKMLIAALSHSGYPTAQVGVNPLDSIRDTDTRINNAIMTIEYQCEQALPATFIYMGGFLREMYRMIGRNGLVIMAVDAPESRRLRKVPFLDTEISFDDAPFTFAIKKKIPIIPLFPVRKPDGRHVMVIHEDINTGTFSTEASRLGRVQQRFLDLFQYHVKRNPSHYVRSLYSFRNRAHPLDRKESGEMGERKRK